VDGSDPRQLKEAYAQLNKWIGSSLDQYKNELYTVTYPIFVHCFLDMVARDFTAEATSFMSDYSIEHLQYVTSWPRVAWHGTARHHNVPHHIAPAPHGTVQHRTAPYNTAQHCPT